MGIAEDKQRIETAVEELKTVIASKGVDVPEGTRIDGLPSLTSNIPSGGDNETLKAIIDRSITSVEIPSGTTQIGWAAFQACKNLSTVTLPDEITVFDTTSFSGCSNLESINFPKSLTFIRNNAFAGCSKLAAIVFPESLGNIYSNAFVSCTGLTCVTFKGTLQSIAPNAFNACTNLTTINVPWSEGAVANAPWGATNATINYNYTEETENAG